MKNVLRKLGSSPLGSKLAMSCSIIRSKPVSGIGRRTRAKTRHGLAKRFELHGLESEVGEHIEELLAEGLVSFVGVDASKRAEESDNDLAANDDEDGRVATSGDERAEESDIEFETSDDAEGRVATSDDELKGLTTVMFKWHGAVQSQDDGKTWRFVDASMSRRLEMGENGGYDPTDSVWVV